MSGWYNSAMNYDMITAGPWNNMNLHMNQMMDHGIAWNNMFTVPSYSFGGFMPYGNMGFNNNYFMTNPMYTVGQMSWGTPMWNSNPWGGNMWGSWGWNGGNFNASGGGNNDDDTGINKKYNTLLSLAKQLVKYNDLTSTEVDTLKKAIKNNNGTKEEQYDRLLEAYNKIPKSVVRDFLANNASGLGVKSDVNGNVNDDDTFIKRLLEVGHELTGLSDLGADSHVEKFYNGVTKLSGSNGTDADCQKLIEHLGTSVDILDFISSWNSTYIGSSDSSRVIDHIAKYYNAMEGDCANQRKDAKSLILDKLVLALIDKAKTVRKGLDAESAERISDAINRVRGALNNSVNSIDSNLSSSFDELYLLTRTAALAHLQKNAMSHYGEIDSKVFNMNLFSKEMDDDLKDEGFDEAEIENAAVKLTEGRRDRASANDDSDDDSDDYLDGYSNSESGSGSETIRTNKYNKYDNDSTAVQLKALVDDGILVDTGATYNGQKVYAEADGRYTKDSDGDKNADCARLFYINADGNLVELTGKKLNGGNIENISDSEAPDAEQVVKASKVANYKAIAAEEVKLAEKETEKEKKIKEIDKRSSKTYKNHRDDYIKVDYAKGGSVHTAGRKPEMQKIASNFIDELQKGFKGDGYDSEKLAKAAEATDSYFRSFIDSLDDGSSATFTYIDFDGSSKTVTEGYKFVSDQEQSDCNNMVGSGITVQEDYNNWRSNKYAITIKKNYIMDKFIEFYEAQFN